MTDFSWDKMLDLLRAHNELVYPQMCLKADDKFNDKFLVSIINFNGKFKRPKCQQCGNLVARKPNSVKIWKERGHLCRKCYLKKQLEIVNNK
jgi:NAD-dependent SIR2 family protein deacetylase